MAPASAPIETPRAPALRGAPRPPLLRRRDGRVLSGVAVGLAEHLGVPVRVVRLVLVLTSVPFGAGLVVYIFLWATMSQAPRSTTVTTVTPVATVTTAPPGNPNTGPSPSGTGLTGTGTSVAGEVGAAPSPGPAGAAPTPSSGPAFDLRSVRTWLRSGNEAIILTLLGLAALAIAGALWLTSAGLDVRPDVFLPVVAIVIGAIFFWSQLDETDGLGARRPVRWIWLVVGLALTTLGLVALLVRGTSIGDLWQVAGAVVVALVGVAVLAAPWILRLWSRLREEQAARIRATERADIAAHLHDSVLQTLALIQRQSGDASTVARLARAQERQLRSYLYDQDAHPDSLGAALKGALDEVEDLQGVPVQLVVTGDRPMDGHLDALVKAVREAAWNAVRHASPPITAYVEVGPKAVEAFVRDHGSGFDLREVPDDRAGVRESIIGRMERHGGSARIRRRPDGTEIELRLPVDAPSTSTSPSTPSEPAGPGGTTGGPPRPQPEPQHPPQHHQRPQEQTR